MVQMRKLAIAALAVNSIGCGIHFTSWSTASPSAPDKVFSGSKPPSDGCKGLGGLEGMTVGRGQKAVFNNGVIVWLDDGDYSRTLKMKMKIHTPNQKPGEYKELKPNSTFVGSYHTDGYTIEVSRSFTDPSRQTGVSSGVYTVRVYCSP